jgi:hypothetical protein
MVGSRSYTKNAKVIHVILIWKSTIKQLLCSPIIMTSRCDAMVRRKAKMNTSCSSYRVQLLLVVAAKNEEDIVADFSGPPTRDAEQAGDEADSNVTWKELVKPEEIEKPLQIKSVVLV